MISMNTNVSALTANRHLNITNSQLQRTTERLSSNMRINRAADDPSGLFAAESLTTQIRGSYAAIGNIQQALSVAEIGDQAMSTMTDTLQRMRELSISATSGLLSTEQRDALDDEYQALNESLQSIVDSATFGGQVILDGTFAGVTLQVGPGTTATATLDITDVSGEAPAGDLTSVANAETATGDIDTALTNINVARATVGAQISGLLAMKGALEVQAIANTDARSRIRDADIASEVTNLVQAQLRQQAGASALSAANFSSQFVLSLLQ
jgi:flagellin